MDKYYAARKFSKVDPVYYESARFSLKGGNLIDELEKKTVLDLLERNSKPKKKNLSILDVACGTGRLALFLKKYLPWSEITGVDINNHLLINARLRAKQDNIKVIFIQGDLYKLPFADNSFDAVVGLRFSMHLPQLNEVIRELSRVLKINRILIFDIFNKNSLLRLNDTEGSYSLRQLVDLASKNKLQYLEACGIFLLGETVIRKFPSSLLFLLQPVIKPVFFDKISTKLIICFKKV